MVDPAVEDKIVAATENRFDELPVEQKKKLMDDDDKSSGSGRRHLFGRRKPLHAALGSGKTADILLWRQNQMSGAIIVSATVIWLLFERIGYHLLPFLCHFLILALAILFLWSNLSSFVNKSPPNFPDFRLSQQMCNFIALLLKDQINEGCLYLRQMTTGKDLKRIMSVILTLWIVSVIGGWFEFLTLVYISELNSFTSFRLRLLDLGLSRSMVGGCCGLESPKFLISSRKSKRSLYYSRKACFMLKNGAKSCKFRLSYGCRVLSTTARASSNSSISDTALLDAAVSDDVFLCCCDPLRV